MALLEGDLAKSIFKGFKGKLLSGTIRQRATPDSGALDEYGDPVEVTATDTAMEGFVEDYDDQYRVQAGIPETDVLVNIFAQSCPAVRPSKDDVVKFTQGGTVTWYQLRRVRTDPALALWSCQAFVIEEPATEDVDPSAGILLLLEGDASGNLLLEGDAQSGTDRLILEGTY